MSASLDLNQNTFRIFLKCWKALAATGSQQLCALNQDGMVISVANHDTSAAMVLEFHSTFFDSYSVHPCSLNFLDFFLSSSLINKCASSILALESLQIDLLKLIYDASVSCLQIIASSSTCAVQTIYCISEVSTPIAARPLIPAHSHFHKLYVQAESLAEAFSVSRTRDGKLQKIVSLSLPENMASGIKVDFFGSVGSVSQLKSQVVINSDSVHSYKPEQWLINREPVPAQDGFFCPISAPVKIFKNLSEFSKRMKLLLALWVRTNRDPIFLFGGHRVSQHLSDPLMLPKPFGTWDSSVEDVAVAERWSMSSILGTILDSDDVEDVLSEQGSPLLSSRPTAVRLLAQGHVVNRVPCSHTLSALAQGTSADMDLDLTAGLEDEDDEDSQEGSPLPPQDTSPPRDSTSEKELVDFSPVNFAAGFNSRMDVSPVQSYKNNETEIPKGSDIPVQFRASAIPEENAAEEDSWFSRGFDLFRPLPTKKPRTETRGATELKEILARLNTKRGESRRDDGRASVQWKAGLPPQEWWDDSPTQHQDED